MKYRVRKDNVLPVWYLQKKIMNEHCKMQWVIKDKYASEHKAYEALHNAT